MEKTRKIICAILAFVSFCFFSSCTSVYNSSSPTAASEFNGNYYLLYENSFTWDEADRYCKALGGHLATITSQDEQNYIAMLFSQSTKDGCWLGGELTAGSFNWVTNENMTYTNWAIDEPNNYLNRNETCMIMLSSTMEWYDFCNNGDQTGIQLTQIAFICEWEGSHSTMNTSLNDEKIYANQTTATTEATTKTCLTAINCSEFTRYTGNLGDSSFNALDKLYTLHPSGDFYGYTNIGVDGIQYDNGFCVWIARWNYGDKISWAQAKFDLFGNYKTLSGKSTLLQSYNTKNFDTTVYFYNGDQLLYSFEMTQEQYNFDFSFDVSDVQELTVLVKDNKETAGGTSFALYDLFLTA
ncbi:MAG: C-type lectin domain-containing protein [Clostridiales bacterium]|nr:C-type lectin domain-containing protein [Clostridiales bacterium]MCD7828537.1 C-type lectin domain-containing protein [Clostridiales bacterium]